MFRWSRLRQQLHVFAWVAVATATVVSAEAGIALCQPEDNPGKAKTADRSGSDVTGHALDQRKSPEATDRLLDEWHLPSPFTELLQKTNQESTKGADAVKRVLSGMSAPRPITGVSPLMPMPTRSSAAATGATLRGHRDQGGATSGFKPMSGRAELSSFERRPSAEGSLQWLEAVSSSAGEQGKAVDAKKPEAEQGTSGSDSSREPQQTREALSARPTPQEADFLKAVSSQNATVIERKSATSIFITHGGSSGHIEATDMTGTLDVVSRILGDQHGQGTHPLLVFRGRFTRAEAESFAEVLRVRREDDLPDILVDMEGGSALEMASLLKQGEYHPKDFRVISVVDVETVSVDTKAVEVVVEAENTTRTKSVLFVIKLLFRNFKESVSVLRESARSAVNDILAQLRLKQTTWSAQRIAAETNRALRQRFGPEFVQVTVKQVKGYAIVELMSDRVAA